MLAAYAGMQAALAEHGTFDARTKEAIALTVAAVDRCGYCQAAHTASATKAGWSIEETVAHVAVNLFTNYFNHYAGTELDVPAAARVPMA